MQHSSASATFVRTSNIFSVLPFGRTCTICLHLQHLTAPAQFYRLRSDFLLPPPAFPQRFSVSWTPASSSRYSDGLALQLAPDIFSLAVRCFFLHFPSDAISSSTYIRTRFSGPRRCVCSIVSWGLITAGTPTARCSRGGRTVSLILLRHWCWKTHGSNPLVSLDGTSGSGVLPAT